MTKVNPFLVIFILSLSVNAALGYLSYRFYSEKGVAQAALFSCQESNKQLEKTIGKQEKELFLQDSTAKDLKQKQHEIQQQECSSVVKILAIPSTKQKDNIRGRISDEVDIDSKLPVDVVRLLQQASSSLQRSSSSDAKQPPNN